MKKTIVPLILGSQSPRRRELLSAFNLPFEVMVRPTDEVVNENLSPEEVVKQIAEEKALAFKDICAHYLIITADTIVVVDNQILGKPKDKTNACMMLGMLANRVHEVKTAVCLLYNNELTSFVETTKVYFNQLTAEEINYYVEKYKPFDKAGAYGVQEWIGMVAIRYLEGDFYNVMGLPTSKLYQTMKEKGYIVD